MNDKLKSILADSISEYSEILSLKEGEKRNYPNEFKQRICELNKSGIKVGILSRHFKLSLGLIYTWIRNSRKGSQITITPAKRLRLKQSSPLNHKIPQAIEPKASLGRFIFRSGIQLELKMESIDLQFLNLLNNIEA